MSVFCKYNPPDNHFWCNVIWGYCQFHKENYINEHCPIYQGYPKWGVVITGEITPEIIQKYSYATIYDENGHLVSLGDSAYSGCDDELKLVVPYVQYIGQYAFRDCINLVELDFSDKEDDEIPVLSSPSAFMKSNSDEFVNDTFVIKVPSRLVEVWKTSTNWIALAERIRGV